ncbi:hypothetical protein JQX13_14730 [Archangium violaceum]|uniref:hypothetical protein n=1 Tax=Archangium violaceum TaxID=83451 RepID=UPI00193C79F6|nr:hypothetical protein [Archangium violaceum]QRK11212.1 hypothetical protein JQX13_14730 [Archangium violaceum]
MRQHARAALVALAVLATGCGGCKERQQGEPPAGAEGPEARPATPRRVGVKVPMPTGWTAQVARDGSFQFGPPGHPVLRVDLRSGQGDSLPAPEALVEMMGGSFQDFERTVEQQQGGSDFSLVRVSLSSKLSDGGMGSRYPALFGARRVEDDLFLCATFPGVTEGEVDLATEACRGIEFQQQR